MFFLIDSLCDTVARVDSQVRTNQIKFVYFILIVDANSLYRMCTHPKKSKGSFRVAKVDLEVQRNRLFLNLFSMQVVSVSIHRHKRTVFFFIL